MSTLFRENGNPNSFRILFRFLAVESKRVSVPWSRSELMQNALLENTERPSLREPTRTLNDRPLYIELGGQRALGAEEPN